LKTIWNTEKRIKKFVIKVNEIDAYFDVMNLKKFTLLINFFKKLVNEEKD